MNIVDEFKQIKYEGRVVTIFIVMCLSVIEYFALTRVIESAMTPFGFGIVATIVVALFVIAFDFYMRKYVCKYFIQDEFEMVSLVTAIIGIGLGLLFKDVIFDFGYRLPTFLFNSMIAIVVHCWAIETDQQLDSIYTLYISDM